MKVVTRMAPSPTGEYHLGHLRTVLYNYALARKYGGKFIIRIEDTDKERLIEGAADRILDVITDYGLSWDEGPRVGGPNAPYVQSQRLDIYRKYALELVALGKAYFCFCSQDQLKKLREKQQERKLPVTKYDKHCISLSAEECAESIECGKPYVIRLKVPEGRTITFVDEIIGEVSVNSNDLDDAILLKSDGYPTYHLAVVVDDHLYGVTHVMRGSDWLPSTPKHVLIYEAFSWEIPKYIHLPNIKEIGQSKKLSKRFKSRNAASFLCEGYLPEAVLNYLMLLGWNPGSEKEIFSLDEFVKEFSIERLHKSDLVAFDEEKLLWMNGYYIRSLTADELYRRIKEWARKHSIPLKSEAFDDSYAVRCLSLVKERMKKLQEFDDLTSFFFMKRKVEETMLSKFTGNWREILEGFSRLYGNSNFGKWNKENIELKSHNLVRELGVSTKEAFMVLRVALTGSEATPPIFDVLAVLGGNVVTERLKEYI